MRWWQKYKPYVWQIALALGVGGVSALVSGSMTGYADLVQPPLSPPGWLFPVVWTVLYILMGVAAGLVKTSGDSHRADAIQVYALQLLLNFLWSPLFFGLNWYAVAAVELGLLVLAVIATVRRFCRVSQVAGWLLVPYLAWCLFALYLNIGVVVLN